MTQYQFSKTGAIIAKPKNMPGPGAYYSSIVDMQHEPHFPADHAMYFSTDHVPGAGGIWLYLSVGDPSIEQNWISYDQALEEGKFDYLTDKPPSNPIYVDHKQSDGHTETAHVNRVGNQFVMTYHKDRIPPTQATLLATSKDGINFSRINGDEDSVVLRYDSDKDPGNGHTGYFRWDVNPFEKIKEKYIGYSLHGGGDDYYSALWGSDDALNWHRLNILAPIEGQAIDHDDRMIVWHEIDPNTITKIAPDEYIAIAAVSTRSSGSDVRTVELYQLYLAGDGVTLKRQAKKILGVGSESDLDSEELTSPSIIHYKDKIVLIYVGVCNNAQLNTVMAGTGKLNETSLPELLDEGIQQKHLIK